ncbi:AsnC family transcriptional regulator [Gordonia sp. NPDC003424]
MSRKQETPGTLGDDDLRLIHALQIAPRASWTDLGRVLGLDPVTVSRRWKKLHDAGLAWVAAYPTDQRIAIIEIDCPPGRSLEIAQIMARDPHTMTIDLTTGGRDIVATVNAVDEEALADYVFTGMTALHDVRSMRTHILSDVVRDARGWELRSLSSDETAQLGEVARLRPIVRKAAVTADEQQATLGALIADGRAGPGEVAKRTGMPVDRARAALYELLASNRVTVRTEVARAYSGRPAYAWFFISTTARSVDNAIAKLSTLQDLRLLARSLGPYTIVMAMWLRSLQDIHHVETVIERTVPELRIEDRSLVLRTPKHVGWMLSDDGRNTGVRQWIG